MICLSCRRGWHACKGGTWCDCQHRDPGIPRELGAFLASADRDAAFTELVRLGQEMEAEAEVSRGGGQ